MARRRIVIVANQPLLRDALVERICARIGDAEVVYAGASIAEALVIPGPVACAILDPDPAEGCTAIRNTADLVAAGMPVLVVSACSDPATVRSTLAAGALGFVSKQTSTEDLLDAVEEVLAGNAVLSPDAADVLARSDDEPVVALSERERTALVLYTSGLKIDAVAHRMGIKATTAGEYIRRVREKYLRAGRPLPTKTDLYRQARADGLVT